MSLVGRSFACGTFAQALSGDVFVRAMVDFERALAEAEGERRRIPPEAARAIASACADRNLPPQARAREGKRSGSPADALERIAAGLVVNAGRMKANLDETLAGIADG